MKNKKLIGLVTLSAATLFALAACGGGNNNSGGSNNATPDRSKFPVETTNKKDAIEGGTLDIAVVNDSPFQGLFNPALYQDSYDMDYMRPTGAGSLFNMDPTTGKVADGGPANFKLDRASKKRNSNNPKERKMERWHTSNSRRCYLHI